MIRLERDKVFMEVCTEVQASAFLNNGWKRAVIEIVKVESAPEVSLPQYNKTDINRMSTSELKDLATANGISGAEEMTGGELKKILIKHFNL